MAVGCDRGGAGCNRHAVEGRREHVVHGVGEHEVELLAGLFRKLLEIRLVLVRNDHALDPRALVRRIFEEGINASNDAVFQELLVPGFVNHDLPSPRPGPEGFAMVVAVKRRSKTSRGSSGRAARRNSSAPCAMKSSDGET